MAVTETALTRAVARVERAKAELARATADRDAAIVALRAEGETLDTIAGLAHLSGPGVHKLLRRQVG